MDSDDNIIVRVGTFFVLIGFFVFILFVASDFAQKPNFDFLFLAMFALGLGWLFRRRKPPRPSAGRFSIITKARESAKKRKEEQAKKAKEKK
jgi:flagellar biosynthesis component FlhA